MSIQTNFRAQDMLGTAKPEPKVAPAPAKKAPKPAPRVEAPVVEESVVEVVAEAETTVDVVEE
jgi:hypothetical protein